MLLIHSPLDSKSELLVLETRYRIVKLKYLLLVMIELFFIIYLICVKCNVKCPIIVPQCFYALGSFNFQCKPNLDFCLD